VKLPDEKSLAKMRKKLEKAKGTVMLSENPSPSEQLRWDICQLFIKYANSKDLKNIQLAKKLEIHESEVIKVLHQRIERFSTDKLLDSLSKIYPKHKILLKAA